MPPHFDTPKKSKIRGASEFIKFLESKQKDVIISAKTQAIADCFNTTPRAVSKILSKKRDRRTFEEGKEPRGGQRGDEVLHITKENKDKCEALIENYGFEGHDLDYGSLRYEAQLPRVCDKTIYNHLKKKGIQRYVAYITEELEEDHAKERLGFAKEMLSLYPTKKEWKKVRFSDELHYGYGNKENKH
jgi:hypothetical protein